MAIDEKRFWEIIEELDANGEKEMSVMLLSYKSAQCKGVARKLAQMTIDFNESFIAADSSQKTFSPEGSMEIH